MDNTFSISFQSTAIAVYIILGLAALAVSWWSYQKTTGDLGRFKQYLLIGLRTVGLLLVMIFLLEPVVSLFQEKTTGEKLGIVVDLSASMQTSEDNYSRLEQAGQAINSNLPDNIGINWFGFADTLTKLNGFPEKSQAGGLATDLSQAFSEEITGNEEIGAVLLVTDGASNIGAEPLRMASQTNLPIYSLVSGNAAGKRDVYIADLNYSPVGFTNTAMNIAFNIGAIGFEGAGSILEIKENGKAVESRTLKLPADGALTTVEFELTFADDGTKNLSAELSTQAGELLTDNNIRQFSIKLLKDKIRIALYAGSLTWEYTFLKRSLESDGRFAISSAIANRRGRFAASDMPIDQSGWQEHDLVIVMDAVVSAFGSRSSSLIDAVRDGVGFMYLMGSEGGIESLRTWSDVLGLEINPSVQITHGEYFAHPGSQARAQVIMQIEGLSWEDQPPLKTIVTGLEPAGDALTFLSAVSSDGNSTPVVIGNRYGGGKTIAITAYSWWPRYFYANIQPQDKVAIDKFWGNLIRWLVVREDSDRFNISPSEAVYRLGEPVEFSAMIFDDNYNLLNGAVVEVIISDSTGTSRELKLSGKSAGRYEGIFGSPAAGKYSYIARTMIGDDTLSAQYGNFVVESFSLEMEDLSANYALMNQIAEITGAKSYTINDFSKFKTDLKLKTGFTESIREYRLTGNYWYLILIMLMFSLEWAIRKFNQLP